MMLGENFSSTEQLPPELSAWTCTRVLTTSLTSTRFFCGITSALLFRVVIIALVLEVCTRVGLGRRYCSCTRTAFERRSTPVGVSGTPCVDWRPRATLTCGGFVRAHCVWAETANSFLCGSKCGRHFLQIGGSPAGRREGRGGWFACSFGLQ